MTFALIAFQDLRSGYGTHFPQCWLWSPGVIYTHRKRQPLEKCHSAKHCLEKMQGEGDAGLQWGSGGRASWHSSSTSF